MRKSTINSAIQEKENLLYLTPGEGKNTRVFLTNEGKRRSKETIEHLLQIEEDILRSWTENERKSFMELNLRFSGQLKEKIDRLGDLSDE